MKKALYITYDGLSDPLGQSQILPYLKGLSKDVSWTVLSFEKKKAPKFLIQKISEELTNYQIRWIKITYYERLLFKIYGIFIGFISVIFRFSRYHVIHVRSYMAAMVGLPLKKIFRSKFIFDMRGFWPEERVEGGLWKKNSLIFKIMKFLEKKYIQKANHIVVLTSKAKQILLNPDLYSVTCPVSVIPTCVDRDMFKPSFNKNKVLTLCYMGSIGTWYKLNEMISFFNIFKIYYPHAILKLLINWTSWQREKNKLEKLVNSNIYIETVHYNDIPQKLNDVHVGLFFIEPTFSKQASCPTKLGEFLAAGIPVITNRGIGDCDEWIEKEKIGILVDDFTPKSYRDAATQVPQILMNSAERCQTFAKQHLSLEKGIQSYQNIFQKIIE